jgi:hypothetical protein
VDTVQSFIAMALPSLREMQAMGRDRFILFQAYTVATPMTEVQR